jgi:hypothetical protein
MKLKEEPSLPLIKVKKVLLNARKKMRQVKTKRKSQYLKKANTYK